MRWLERLKPKSRRQPLPAQALKADPVPMEQWDEWARQLDRGQLRHDVYIERLLWLPHILTLAWIAPNESHPRPMPFHNHARQTLILPIFTGTDALRRFAEIQKIEQPLVLSFPTAEAWTLIAGLEVDGITINAGGPAALSCSMDQVVMLAELATRKHTC